MNPFVDLVTLATSYPSTVRKLELSDGTSEASWYEVGMRQGSGPGTKAAPIWSDQAILKFEDLDPVKHIPLWYEMAHKLQGIFDYAFGARYSVDISPENRYLNATTAAEAMHRELIRATRKSVDLNDPAVRAFVESFPEDEQELLTERVKHLNDASFHMRLEHIYDTARPFSERLAPNKEGWITAVKKARNALTHQSGSIPQKIPSGDKLVVLAESLFMLISVYIVVELGFSAKDIDGWMNRQHRTKSTIDFLLATFPEFNSSPKG